MAHEIEQFEDGTAAFASARMDAWHRLGTVFEQEMTAEQAMEAAALGGWDVRKAPITAQVIGEDGVSSLEVPDTFATIRTHPKTGKPETLGIVGSHYTPVQNEEHADLLNTLVDESGARIETAGSLKGGREVFLTMKLPETMTVGGADDLDLYIAALNSHDGSSAFRLLVTPIRIVCANTQAVAISAARSSFSIRHTVSAKGQIAEARNALGLTWKYLETFQAEAEKMIQKTLRAGDFTKIVDKVFPVDKDASESTKKRADERMGTLRELFANAGTQKPIAGSRWAGLQAITEYVDHYAPVKGADDAESARALRTLTSKHAATVKQNAYRLLAV